MKKTFLVLLTVQLIFSCQNNKNDEKSADKKDSIVTEQSADNENVQSKNISSNSAFDINTIPISSSDIGDFPFFTLPKGFKNQNRPFQKSFDVCYFPINGVMTPFEGQLYKTNVTTDGNEEYSQMYYIKSVSDYLGSIGAVKVFDGTITAEEYKRYSSKDPNKGDEGDMGYEGEQIKFYVLRTKDRGNIYIQFSSNNASGKLNILQEEALQQTIQKITSEKIEKDLMDNGRSILHINFDTDKATLKQDGREIVQEIVKALQNKADLKIAINGYTDNSGSKAHNLLLSKERAKTIQNEIVKAGIAKDRLTAEGFGQDHPISDNTNEDGKAKNRRVELLKL